MLLCRSICRIHDRNQGEIARSQAAVRQSIETESSTKVGVRTDVVNAYYGLQSNEEIVNLYESGYLKQASDPAISAPTPFSAARRPILDVLDAERSYRATQLGYRQALAAQMTAVEQVNQAVGAQVIPMRFVDNRDRGCAADRVPAVFLQEAPPPRRRPRQADEGRAVSKCRQNQLPQLKIVEVRKTVLVDRWFAPPAPWIGTPITPRRRSPR